MPKKLIKKNPFLSKTIIGALLSLIPGAAIPVITALSVTGAQSPVPPELQAIAAGIAAIITIYGRFKATGTISFK